MSEPLTSHEIEDVLSSIRRLVSDELRPVSRKAVEAKTSNALLLTPALRVVPDAVEEAPEQFDDVSEDFAPADTFSQQNEVPMADDVLTDPAENAVEPEDPWSIAPPTQDYDDQIPAGEVFVSRRDPALTSEPGFASPVSADWNETSDVMWSSAGAPDDVTADHQAPAPDGDVQSGHWSQQDVPEASWASDEDEWSKAETLAFVAHPRKPSLAADPLARAWADKAEAEVRAGLGETVVPPKAEPRKTSVPPTEPPRSAASPEPGIFDGSDQELDEEALREIVRDIIREELAGTLGERITRNVRKLVRVEINRALTAREFE